MTDLTTPDGFTPVSLFVYPDLYQLPVNAYTETLVFQVGGPLQVDQQTWEQLIDDVRGAVFAQGYDILAFGVWEQPTSLLSVPTEVCFFSTDFCAPIPPQLCLPVIGCINLAGQQIVGGWLYQVWMLVQVTGSATPLYYSGPDGLRGQVVIGIGFAVAVLILIVAAALGFVLFRGIATGQVTTADIAKLIHDWLGTPGQNVQSIEWPLVILGAVAILAGVSIPALALSGQIQLPGGLGGGASVSAGGTGAPPGQSSPGGRRRP